MKRKLDHRRVVSRAGLTYIDMIIIIIALLLLVSIFFPFNDRAYRIRHRLECANNLKHLALAVTARASANNGKVPLLSEPGPGMASDIQVGWPIHLFPYLDRSDVIEYVQAQETNQKAKLAIKHVLSNKFKSLQCPMEPTQFNRPGGVSFAANIGYGAWRGTPDGVVAHYDLGATDHGGAAIDWNDNGKLDSTDKEVALGSGVFWFANESTKGLALDDIVDGDGSGSTILFAESMNMTPMHQAGPKGNGENPRALDMGIGIGYDSLRLMKAAKPSLFLDRSLKATADYNAYFKPNSNQGTARGKWPAVSSLHPGGVNVVFADGHVGFINEEIDWAVWASLHTPLGMQYGQAPVSEGKF